MDINYTNSNANVNSILYEAQLIANAFSRALEDNNCLLILPIGLHQEIDNGIKDVEDLVKTIDDINNNLDKNTETGTDNILDVLDEAIQDSKDKCFTCKLEMPGIDFNVDLKGALGRLSAQVQLYKSMFEFNKLDLCQASYSLMQGCLPDILKLITLLLTAYVSIMTLKKLSNVSIMSFIKGILSTLLSKLLGSLKITMNIGNTNISCLINALREIALSLPTQEAIQARLTAEENYALGLIDANKQTTNSNLLRNKMVDDLYKNLDDNHTKISNLDSDIGNIDDKVNETFKLVSDVVDTSLEEVNEYVKNLLSFQTYFECETVRSGMDVEDALVTVNKLIQVLNLLSAIALSIAKKEIRDKACKTDKHINSLSDSQINDLQLKDIVEEYNKTTTDLINSNENGLELLIKEDPVEDGLPKIDLLDCSINDFVEAHTLPNIIRVARKQVERERRRPLTYTPESVTYIFRKPSGDQLDYINNLVDMIYIPPVEEVPEENTNIVVPPIVNPIQKDPETISNILEDVLTNAKDKSKATKLACRSIDDVLDVLNSIK